MTTAGQVIGTPGVVLTFEPTTNGNMSAAVTWPRYALVLATPERVICAGILVAVLVKEPGEATPMIPVPLTAAGAVQSIQPEPERLTDPLRAGRQGLHHRRGDLLRQPA